MKLLVLSLVAMGVAAGCTEQRNKPQVSAKPKPAKMPSVVVVPENVQGKWRAVSIAVTDKSSKIQRIYTLQIGSEFHLPDTDLTLKAETFLPHFIMEGTTLTSQSNELKNPAVQLSIKEGGREIFKGWLFKLYPTTHAFQHPQYGFTLVDYQAS
jgi:hypothetical protein